MSFTDNFGNEYLDPYIPNKIVGFIGIDPDMKGNGGGTDNHEELTNLLGGDATGHWHVNAEQYRSILAMLAVGDDHEELANLLGGDSTGTGT